MAELFTIPTAEFSQGRELQLWTETLRRIIAGEKLTLGGDIHRQRPGPIFICSDEDPYGSRDPDAPRRGPDAGHSCNHCPHCGVWGTWKCETCGPDLQALNRAYAEDEVGHLDFAARRRELIEQHKKHEAHRDALEE